MRQRCAPAPHVQPTCRPLHRLALGCFPPPRGSFHSTVECEVVSVPANGQLPFELTVLGRVRNRSLSACATSASNAYTARPSAVGNLNPQRWTAGFLGALFCTIEYYLSVLLQCDHRRALGAKQQVAYGRHRFARFAASRRPESTSSTLPIAELPPKFRLLDSPESLLLYSDPHRSPLGCTLIPPNRLSRRSFNI